MTCCVQVVGFFIVEDQVHRTAGAISAAGGGDGGWEAAMAVLKEPLDAAFEALQQAAPLLALKEFVSLACTSLGATLPLHPKQELQTTPALSLFSRLPVG